MTPAEPRRTLTIDVIIPTLGNGGAQRMVALLSAWLAGRGHRVRIITFASTDHPVVHRPTDERVAIEPIGRHTGTRFSARSLLAVLWRLRGTVLARAPDVVLSFQDIASFPALVTLPRRLPVVVAERHDPHTYSRPGLRARLRAAFYPRAAAIVVQTRMLAARYADALQARLHVLPNPCPGVTRTARPDAAPGEARTAPPVRRMVTVGRLEASKELALLIDAAAIAFQGRDGWRLDIHGVGPLEGALRERIASHRLTHRIALAGHCPDVPDTLTDAHLFVFPSSTEGFPNALAEGIACGLPCIAYRGVSGVDELIRDGENGELLDPADRTPQALADALARAMDDPQARARHGARSLEIAREFDRERLFGQWEHLLVEAANRAAR